MVGPVFNTRGQPPQEDYKILKVRFKNAANDSYLSVKLESNRSFIYHFETFLIFFG
jgi:hypothetical protein